MLPEFLYLTRRDAALLAAAAAFAFLLAAIAVYQRTTPPDDPERSARLEAVRLRYGLTRSEADLLLRERDLETQCVTARLQAVALRNAAEIYRLEHGKFPTDLTDLPLEPRHRIDPWGRAFRLRTTGNVEGSAVVWTADPRGRTISDP